STHHSTLTPSHLSLYLYFSRPTQHLHSFPTRRSSDLTRTTSSDGDGHFVFTLLPPGRYRVEVAAQGFQTYQAKLVVNITQTTTRSEEHTSELQSQSNLVCRLLLEKKKKNKNKDDKNNKKKKKKNSIKINL